MKVHTLNHSRATLTAVCGIAFLAGISTFRANADEWDRETILTVNQTIQVRDTVLDPGQYVFRLFNSQSDRHIVQIFNADQSHLISTVFAIPAQRLEPPSDSQFTFWETPPGTAKAMRAWFYPGDTIGQEFPYPNRLKELALVTTPTPATGAGGQGPGAGEDGAMAGPVQPAPAVEPEASVGDTGESRDREASEAPMVAEAAPPATPEPAATPTPTEQPPAELPKTASPYPPIGLAGAVLLGFAGLLRLKRWS